VERPKDRNNKYYSKEKIKIVKKMIENNLIQLQASKK